MRLVPLWKGGHASCRRTSWQRAAAAATAAAGGSGRRLLHGEDDQWPMAGEGLGSNLLSPPPLPRRQGGSFGLNLGEKRLGLGQGRRQACRQGLKPFLAGSSSASQTLSCPSHAPALLLLGLPSCRRGLHLCGDCLPCHDGFHRPPLPPRGLGPAYLPLRVAAAGTSKRQRRAWRRRGGQQRPAGAL